MAPFSGLVSVPLRGLSQWKGVPPLARMASSKRFSPLAGIKSVESKAFNSMEEPTNEVSVPLRGLSQWKDETPTVSLLAGMSRFSPLAGIKSVERKCLTQ